MSKYRRGALFLRRLKPTDKSNDFRTAMRLGMFSEPNIWKHPERVKPVVLVQHSVNNVVAVFMNKADALGSLFGKRESRLRNARWNKKRGQRQTIGDMKKTWRRWAWKHNKPEAVKGNAGEGR